MSKIQKCLNKVTAFEIRDSGEKKGKRLSQAGKVIKSKRNLKIKNTQSEKL